MQVVKGLTLSWAHMYICSCVHVVSGMFWRTAHVELCKVGNVLEEKNVPQPMKRCTAY